ncbi:MAG TPA: thioesterase family protein [Candidatus Thermoplasmatota archaeon]|nr:thioesterase family protein [Candidatus Thermoplasmatota archaeon]
MYPWLRLVKATAGTRWRSRLAPLGESVLPFRVWPGDLDTNRHLNNGRYLTLMDLGRWDLMGRTGLLRHALERKWMPVVAAATIRFRRPIGPYARFTLHTRLLGWDDRSFYIAQTFRSGGKDCAEAVVRAMVLEARRKVPPQEAMDLVQPGMESPQVPTWVLSWAQQAETVAPGASRTAGV